MAARPTDRTAGARKQRDHLAPKKLGVDHRLAEFQGATRTIRKAPRAQTQEDSDAAGVSPTPDATPAGEAPAVVDAAEQEDNTDSELRAELRGAGEDWMAVIQRKEAEAQAAREEEERKVAAAARAQENEARAEAARVHREEMAAMRRKMDDERRAVRNAERLEVERKEFEERARTREAELQVILQQAAEPATASSSTRAAEREARKARIAELVSRVKSTSMVDEAEAVPAV